MKTLLISTGIMCGILVILLRVSHLKGLVLEAQNASLIQKKMQMETVILSNHTLIKNLLLHQNKQDKILLTHKQNNTALHNKTQLMKQKLTASHETKQKEWRYDTIPQEIAALLND